MDAHAQKRPRAEADCRGWRGRWCVFFDCGQYFVIDYRKNYLVQHDVSLTSLGQELGVIAQWEVVADD
jgi:hypothetical protein